MSQPITQNGAAVRTIRKAVGLSTNDLVNKLEADHGITVGIRHISNVERNATGASPNLLTAIAAVLRAPLAAILANPAAPPAKQARVSA